MKHLDMVMLERIGNGFILTWWHGANKQIEYYPTTEALSQRINDMFTAEKEGIEIVPLKIVKVEF